MRQQTHKLTALLLSLVAVAVAEEPTQAASGPSQQANYREGAVSTAYTARSGHGGDLGYGGVPSGYSAGVGGLGGYSAPAVGGYPPLHAQHVGYVVSHHDYSDEKGKGGGKGLFGFGKGRGKGKGYDYDYDYGAYDDSIVVKQPVLVNRPVVVQKPSVAYKTVVVKAPQPTYAHQPILVHKPVIYKTKEWRLVDVPKVHYTPAYISPVYDDYYDEGGKGGKGSKGKGSGWFGSGWW